MKMLIRCQLLQFCCLFSDQSSNHGSAAHLLSLAKQGDAEAQFQLGLAYLEGKGVRKNAFAARKWLTLAANQFGAEHSRSVPEEAIYMEAYRRALMSLMTPKQIALYEALGRSGLPGMTRRRRARYETEFADKRRTLASRITPQQAEIARFQAEKDIRMWVTILTPHQVVKSRRDARKKRNRVYWSKLMDIVRFLCNREKYFTELRELAE